MCLLGRNIQRKEELLKAKQEGKLKKVSQEDMDRLIEIMKQAASKESRPNVNKAH